MPTPSTETRIESMPARRQRPQSCNEDALVLASQRHEHAASLHCNPRLAFLPVELDVAVPVREFRVRNLLALEAGQVIETQWAHGEDVPLAAAGYAVGLE